MEYFWDWLRSYIDTTLASAREPSFADQKLMILTVAVGLSAALVAHFVRISRQQKTILELDEFAFDLSVAALSVTFTLIGESSFSKHEQFRINHFFGSCLSRC